MPDPDDDPISFDFASDEVLEQENSNEKHEQDAARKQQKEESEKVLEDMKNNLKKEKDKAEAALVEREKALLAMKNSGNDQEARELEEQIKVERERARQADADKIKAL